MTKRRKSKEELAEELQTAVEQKNREVAEAEADPDQELDEPIDGPGERAERSKQGGSDNGPGSGPGDFTAISDAQVEEVNELFNLINRSGYLTIGSYNVQSDGEGNIAVTLTAITPSSGGAPSDVRGDTGGGGP